MSATTCLLSKDALVYRAGVSPDLVASLLASRQLQPAYQAGSSLFFEMEQVEAVKSAAVQRTQYGCPRILSASDAVDKLNVPRSRLFRAIESGRIIPEFKSVVAKRASYFFLDDATRLESIRAVLMQKVPRGRYRTKRRMREGDFFGEAKASA